MLVSMTRILLIPARASSGLDLEASLWYVTSQSVDTAEAVANLDCRALLRRWDRTDHPGMRYAQAHRTTRQLANVSLPPLTGNSQLKPRRPDVARCRRLRRLQKRMNAPSAIASYHPESSLTLKLFESSTLLDAFLSTAGMAVREMLMLLVPTRLQHRLLRLVAAACTHTKRQRRIAWTTQSALFVLRSLKLVSAWHDSSVFVVSTTSVFHCGLLITPAGVPFTSMTVSGIRL